MKDETLLKLRQFEESVKTKNAEVKKILTSIPEAVEEVQEAAQAVEKVVAEVVPVVKGWRALFCCGK